MVMMLFLNSTLLDVKKETYEIYTLHVSNNGQLNIYNNTQRSRQGSPKKRKEKKKRLNIVHTDKGTEESFTE